MPVPRMQCGVRRVTFIAVDIGAVAMNKMSFEVDSVGKKFMIGRKQSSVTSTRNLLEQSSAQRLKVVWQHSHLSTDQSM